jgi:hypothetical protein
MVPRSRRPRHTSVRARDPASNLHSARAPIEKRRDPINDLTKKVQENDDGFVFVEPAASWLAAFRSISEKTDFKVPEWDEPMRWRNSRPSYVSENASAINVSSGRAS